MNAAVLPRKDTIGTIEWNELPDSVRCIPANLNLLAEGILMKPQIEWLKVEAQIKVCEKGRRTGITFATALDCTITAASSKEAGGDNVYYVGDTKEKGLEFIGYCAKFARTMAAAQADGISSIEEYLFEDQDAKGNTRYINAYRIRFASGFQIVALSSRPENLRGLQGIVVIDEAAFHTDVNGVIEAAAALRIWNGRIIIISSHNGKNNAFNQLIKDIRAGEYGDTAVVFTVTFDDAVEAGLYERVCLMSGKQPTLEGKEQWYTSIRKGYGSRKAAMRQELDVIPRDGATICLPPLWVENCMPDKRPVLRLSLGDDFKDLPEHERNAFAEQWIKEYLDPELAKLDKSRTHCAGQDYARHRDFSVIMPFALQQDLRRVVPFVVEMNNVPARIQEMILWHMIEGLPNFAGIAMDATGTGETLAEYTADKYGESLVHQIKLNRNWYGFWTPLLVDAFGSNMIDLPADQDLKNDFSAIEDVDGIKMISKARRKDVKEPELYRHGDGACAALLAWYASLNLGAPVDWTPLPTREQLEQDPDAFDDFMLADNGLY